MSSKDPKNPGGEALIELHQGISESHRFSDSGDKQS